MQTQVDTTHGPSLHVWGIALEPPKRHGIGVAPSGRFTSLLLSHSFYESIG
jgi:hypothetical protein